MSHPPTHSITQYCLVSLFPANDENSLQAMYSEQSTVTLNATFMLLNIKLNKFYFIHSGPSHWLVITKMI
jgi:hypothetical protein